MDEEDLGKKAQEFTAPIETVLDENWTVEESLKDLRSRAISQKIIYFYAVDQEGKLKGVVSTRQLLLAVSHQKIKDIMSRSVTHIDAGKSLQEVMEVFEQHPLLAIPVTHQHGRLLGVIDVQKVTPEPVDFLNQRSRMDAFQMIGVTLEERKKIPLFTKYRYRMPWLFCNVFSGLMCALISRGFEEVLGRVILLAFFIPLVLTLSESTSMQAMAQSLQFLKGPRGHLRSIKTRAFREWQLALVIALTLGGAVGSLSLLWGDSRLASFTIGVGIVLGVTASSLFAIAIPIFLHRMKLDPKVASGPVVLMLVDIVATAIYLGIATWWLL